VKTAIILSALLLSTATQASAQVPEVLPHGDIPVMAWIGPPANETTVERYRELRDAGFTHSFSGFPDNDAMEGALDIAGECGISLYIATPELKKDPEGTVRRFMNHPALAGYHLRDEPCATDFADLGAWVKRIRAVDDVHPCYINLFPNYANSKQLGTETYREHVARFIDEVPTQIISFDHYPVTGETIRPEWYENLEIISEEARDAGKPFWAFSLAVAHNPYPVPTLAHLRLQVFSDLAYGASCIQYFTYWTPQSTRWNFHEAPIRVDGTRSVVYERVSLVNREIRALSGVFSGARVISVGHTGDVIPQGTQRFTVMQPFYSFKTVGTGAVVSLLENGGRRFLVAVNRDIHESMSLTVSADIAAKVKVVGKDGMMTLLDTLGSRFEVGPGDVMVFGWGKR